MTNLHQSSGKKYQHYRMQEYQRYKVIFIDQ